MTSTVSYLFVHVHEQDGGHLAHALTVAHFRVVHRVGRQHVEQMLLSEQNNDDKISKLEARSVRESPRTVIVAIYRRNCRHVLAVVDWFCL